MLGRYPYAAHDASGSLTAPCLIMGFTELSRAPPASLCNRLLNMSSSAAEKVPPELFERILNHFEFRREHSFYYPSEEETLLFLSKRQLGQCALVCRYWARICQPMMFEELVLRSRQDALNFFVIASSPHSKISQYVQSLDLEYTLPSPPWTHLVSLKQSLSSCYRISLVVSLDNLQQDLGNPTLNIHSLLPRQNPAFSARIDHLSLSDIKFPHLQSIFALAAAFPSLWTLTCKRVTWPTSPNEVHDIGFIFNSRSRCSRKFTRCIMSECTQDWVVFPVCFALQIHVAGRLWLSREDLLAIYRTILAMKGERRRGMLPLQSASCFIRSSTNSFLETELASG